MSHESCPMSHDLQSCHALSWVMVISHVMVMRHGNESRICSCNGFVTHHTPPRVTEILVYESRTVHIRVTHIQFVTHYTHSLRMCVVSHGYSPLWVTNRTYPYYTYPVRDSLYEHIRDSLHASSLWLITRVTDIFVYELRTNMCQGYFREWVTNKHVIRICVIRI